MERLSGTQTLMPRTITQVPGLPFFGGGEVGEGDGDG